MTYPLYLATLIKFTLSLFFLYPYISFFFFNDTPTTEIYTLSLHDALPIWCRARTAFRWTCATSSRRSSFSAPRATTSRSEEHTSELQSPDHLVCRLLLEKKKKKKKHT